MKAMRFSCDYDYAFNAPDEIDDFLRDQAEDIARLSKILLARDIDVSDRDIAYAWSEYSEDEEFMSWVDVAMYSEDDLASRILDYLEPTTEETQ